MFGCKHNKPPPKCKHTAMNISISQTSAVSTAPVGMFLSKQYHRRPYYIHLAAVSTHTQALTGTETRRHLCPRAGAVPIRPQVMLPAPEQWNVSIAERQSTAQSTRALRGGAPTLVISAYLGARRRRVCVHCVHGGYARWVCTVALAACCTRSPPAPWEPAAVKRETK